MKSIYFKTFLRQKFTFFLPPSLDAKKKIRIQPSNQLKDVFCTGFSPMLRYLTSTPHQSFSWTIIYQTHMKIFFSLELFSFRTWNIFSSVPKTCCHRHTFLIQLFFGEISFICATEMEKNKYSISKKVLSTHRPAKLTLRLFK